jgi:hypothetical protein
MMKENDMIMYIGLISLVLFLFFIISRVFTFQTSMMEGLSNKDSQAQPINVTVGKVENINKVSEDHLFIEKYRSDYEDLIIHLEETTNLDMMRLIKEHGNNIEQGKTVDEQMKTIKKINELNQLKESLNSSMKYIDGK